MSSTEAFEPDKDDSQGRWWVLSVEVPSEEDSEGGALVCGLALQLDEVDHRSLIHICRYRSRTYLYSFLHC